MPGRLDLALARWTEAFAAMDIDALVGVYRRDAALRWMPAMASSEWGHLGLHEFFSRFLSGVTTCAARYGLSIGSDGELCGAPFALTRDGETYEGWGFFRMSDSGYIDIDRRYPGPFWDA